MNWRRRIHLGVIVLMTTAIALIALRLDWVRVTAALASLDWRWVALVPTLNVVTIAIEAVRWKFILGDARRPVSVLNTFTALLVGIVGNIVLPFKLGDSARAYTLSRREGVGMSRAVSSVLLDRIADIVPFAAIAVITAMVASLPAALERSEVVGAGVVVFFVAVLVVLIRAGRRGRFKRFARLEAMIDALAALVAALRHRGRLLRVTLLSFLVWVVRLAIILSMLRAFGLDLPREAGLVILVFISLGVGAVSSPGNIGSFELAAIAALKLFGVETEAALGFAVTLHAVEVSPVIVLGLVALWSTGIRLRDVVNDPIEIAPASTFGDTKR